MQNGKYIYCIIASENDFNFGPIGVGSEGEQVTTIGFEGLCMVVSTHPLDRFEVSPENILKHQQVIETVMQEFNSVLPVRYGTVAANPDEIRNLLNRRYDEFMELLHDFENKVEINVRGYWKNMEAIFKEIDEENKELQEIRDNIESMEEGEARKKKIEHAGEMVQKALNEKREEEADKITAALRKSVFDFKHNRITKENMFMNTAFLISRGRELELDNIMEDLGETYQDRSDFVYTTPQPIFNFIELEILPERWEI